MTKNIVVCGDSFQSISTQENYNGTHWSEILAKKLGCNLINLAMPGCSNAVISLQIMEAINLKPDFIVLGWAASHGQRIEYLNNELDSTKIGKINLGHFLYNYRSHPYDNLNYNKNPILKSSSIPLVHHKEFRNQLATFSAVPVFNYFIDECIMVYSIMKLSKFNIPFLMFETGIGNHIYPLESKWIEEMLDFCEEKNIIFKNDMHKLYSKEELDNLKNYPIYHTSIQTQHIISDYIEQRMKELIK